MTQKPGTETPSIEQIPGSWPSTWSALTERQTSHAVRTALQNRQLVRIARNLYAPAAASEQFWARASAAVQATERRGVVSGTAGLFLHSALAQAPEQILVVLSRHHHVTRKPDGVTYYRASASPELALVDGVPVADPEWCLLHAMREVHKKKRQDVAIMALASGVVDPLAAAELAAKFRQTPGRAALLATISAFQDGARSPLELRAMTEVFTGTAFEHFEWQHRVSVAGRTYYLDVFDADARLAIEFDGKEFHVSAVRWRADRERDAFLASIGIQTLRLTWWDITERPQWCREIVQQAIASRARLRRSA